MRMSVAANMNFFIDSSQIQKMSVNEHKSTQSPSEREG